MIWLIFIALIAIIFFIFIGIRAIKSTNQHENKRNEIKAIFNNHDSRIGQYLIDDKGTNGLGLDDNGDFLLVNNYGNSLSSSLIKPNSILEVSIVEDGSSIIKASRSSQLGGALVGGLIAGGAGALVGSLSGSKNQIRKIKKIALRVVINDTHSPIRNITVIDQDFNIDTNHPTYKVMSHRALEWQKKIEIAVNNSIK